MRLELFAMSFLGEGPILVVEDDSETREALSDLLRLCGYTVFEAENGEAALDKLNSGAPSPALIVLDLAMPVMDGYTLLNRLRSDERARDIPVIVTTSNPPDAPLDGATVLAKPVRPQRLLQLVERLVH